MKLNLKLNAARLIKYAAKRLRVAKRKIIVGKNEYNGMTARMLWEKNFTISNPTPKRAGAKRAMARRIDHRLQWANTPKATNVSRQVQRATERRSLKDAWAYQNRHFAGGAA